MAEHIIFHDIKLSKYSKLLQFLNFSNFGLILTSFSCDIGIQNTLQIIFSNHEENFQVKFIFFFFSMKLIILNTSINLSDHVKIIFKNSVNLFICICRKTIGFTFDFVKLYNAKDK